MGYTENFNIAFFDFGDKLDSQINVQKEIDRFVLIDKQLFGLYSIFGNGVVSGWDIIVTSGLKVTVTSGIGIIQYLACQTTFPQDVIDLPPNDFFSLYAVIDGNTPTNRSINFKYSRVEIGENSIKLANITTGSNGVISVDTSVKILIDFKTFIEQQVNSHKHTGSPSKIQLDQETKGMLPGSNLDDLDASKISSGKIDIERLPKIDHNNLKNVGFLTHPQLETLVNSTTSNNEQLLGEISTVNFLKFIISEKYNNASIDEDFINELAIIPGISPDNFTDWEATTANVSLNTNCIGGIPPSININGNLNPNFQIVPVTWQSDSDFNNASVLSNLTVNNGVKISSDTISDLVIEDFEVVNKPIGFNGTIDETTSISASYDSTVAVQGGNSGKFNIKHSFIAKFRKTYETPLDWTNYNELNVYIRSYNTSHSAVYLKIYNSEDTELATYTLLLENEITTSENDGFLSKIFDITTIQNRSDISKLEIYTSNISSSDEVFFIDNIFVRNTSLYLPQGTMRLRYSSSNSVVFKMVEYISNIPIGTDLRLRVRVADDPISLMTKPFGTRLLNGDSFSYIGKEIDIEVTLYSNTDRTLSPEITWIQLQLLLESESSGFTVDTKNEWERGDYGNNINILTTDNDYINLKYSNIGNMYFLYQDTVNEINPDLIPEFGINGAKIPVSPEQAYNSIKGSPSRGFNGAKSVYRLGNSDYLIADTNNDRVVQVKSDGSFIRGYGCHNRDYDTVSYALTSVYNEKFGKLFITYSMEQVLALYDLSNVHITYGNNSITLSNNVDLIKTLDTDSVVKYDVNATTSVTDRIICIQLSDEHQKQINSTNEQIYVQIDSDSDLNNIECPKCDFLYYGRGAIVRPIFANRINDGKWMIANSHIFTGYDDLLSTDNGKKTISDLISKTISIINIEEETGLITVNNDLNIFDFTYNNIDFSDVTIGGIYPLEKDRLLISGLKKNINSTAPESVTGENDTIEDSERVKGYQGYVILLDKSSQRILFAYESPEGLFPSDIIENEDGLFIVAETSFIEQAGRIIKLDRFGNIISVISDGMYTRINDIRNLSNNHILIST